MENMKADCSRFSQGVLDECALLDDHAPGSFRQRKSFLPERGAGGRKLDAALAKPLVSGFYDKPTGAIQYVVADPATKSCAIIDPILDFDERSGATATKSADALLDFIRANGL